MDYTVLINKENPIGKNYIPKNLVETDNNENNFHNFEDPTMKPTVDKVIYPYFLEMQKDAAKEGINIIVDSGYRSYEYQKVVWDSFLEKVGLEETKKFVASPGTSEHQSGLAIDIAFIIGGTYTDDVKENQRETQWLFNNSYKYGFILRYPKGKEEITGYSFEPWHYRFVGLELAKVIYENNITLEEYYLKKELNSEYIKQKK